MGVLASEPAPAADEMEAAPAAAEVVPTAPGPSTPPEPAAPPSNGLTDIRTIAGELKAAAIRLPVAMILGATLALRWRRKGTPERQPAVIHTQIILAIVGATIMLVIGQSLARAFGIVGIAGLVRYRSKIRDPKDAVVMLAALAVGLAAGVGLFAIATFSTVFLAGALWVIEGFEPQRRTFELTVKLSDTDKDLRARVENVLRRFRAQFELRGTSPQEVSYFVTAPIGVKMDRLSAALAGLSRSAEAGIVWKEGKA